MDGHMVSVVLKFVAWRSFQRSRKKMWQDQSGRPICFEPVSWCAHIFGSQDAQILTFFQPIHKRGLIVHNCFGSWLQKHTLLAITVAIHSKISIIGASCHCFERIFVRHLVGNVHQSLPTEWVVAKRMRLSISLQIGNKMNKMTNKRKDSLFWSMIGSGTRMGGSKQLFWVGRTVIADIGWGGRKRLVVSHKFSCGASAIAPHEKCCGCVHGETFWFTCWGQFCCWRSHTWTGKEPRDREVGFFAEDVLLVSFAMDSSRVVAEANMGSIGTAIRNQIIPHFPFHSSLSMASHHENVLNFVLGVWVDMPDSTRLVAAKFSCFGKSQIQMLQFFRSQFHKGSNDDFLCTWDNPKQFCHHWKSCWNVVQQLAMQFFKTCAANNSTLRFLLAKWLCWWIAMRNPMTVIPMRIGILLNTSTTNWWTCILSQGHWCGVMLMNNRQKVVTKCNAPRSCWQHVQQKCSIQNSEERVKVHWI